MKNIVIEPMPQFTDAHQFINAIERRQARLEQDMRRQVMFWAPVVCTCTPWYERFRPGAPQQGCVVHGGMMLTRDGKWL